MVLMSCMFKHFVTSSLMIGNHFWDGRFPGEEYSWNPSQISLPEGLRKHHTCNYNNNRSISITFNRRLNMFLIDYLVSENLEIDYYRQLEMIKFSANCYSFGRFHTWYVILVLFKWLFSLDEYDS